MVAPTVCKPIYDRKPPGQMSNSSCFRGARIQKEYPLTGVTQTLDLGFVSRLASRYTRRAGWNFGWSHSLHRQHAETAAKKITSNPAYQLYQPHISPDDRWIVFGADANSPNPESALYVVLRVGWSVDAHHRRPALGRQAPLVS